MSAAESLMVWGMLALLALFVGTLWVVQGRMLRRERAREEELGVLRRDVAALWSRYADDETGGG